MRLNKRLILKAPKRGPGELEFELAKLKVLRSSPAYKRKQFARVMKAGMAAFADAIQKACDWIGQLLKPFVDAMNNYSQYKREDKILFSSVPSMRRFEKDML